MSELAQVRYVSMQTQAINGQHIHLSTNTSIYQNLYITSFINFLQISVSNSAIEMQHSVLAQNK